MNISRYCKHPLNKHTKGKRESHEAPQEWIVPSPNMRQESNKCDHDRSEKKNFSASPFWSSTKQYPSCWLMKRGDKTLLVFWSSDTSTGETL